MTYTKRRVGSLLEKKWQEAVTQWWEAKARQPITLRNLGADLFEGLPKDDHFSWTDIRGERRGKRMSWLEKGLIRHMAIKRGISMSEYQRNIERQRLCG